MITNREVVSGLKQLLAERGVINDHTDWSDRLILFYAMRARSAVLKARLDDKRSRVSHFNKQTIPCVPMRKIDLNECPCAPPTGCHFYKSITPIPQPLSRYLQIDNIIGNKDIDYVEWGDFRTRLQSKYKYEREAPTWTIRNLGDGPYLYTYNISELFLTPTSIFENPIEVFLYPNCEGIVENKCAQYLDFPFVIDDGFVGLVMEAAYKMLATKTKEQDKLINQSDDTSNAKLPIK